MGNLRFDLDNKKQNLSGLGKSSFSNFFIRRRISDPFKPLDSLQKKVGFNFFFFEKRWILNALEPKNPKHDLKINLWIFNLKNITKRITELNQSFSKRGDRPLSDDDLDWDGWPSDWPLWAQKQPQSDNCWKKWPEGRNYNGPQFWYHWGQPVLFKEGRLTPFRWWPWIWRVTFGLTSMSAEVTLTFCQIKGPRLRLWRSPLRPKRSNRRSHVQNEVIFRNGTIFSVQNILG